MVGNSHLGGPKVAVPQVWIRVLGIKGGAPRAFPLPQGMLYTFSGRCILSGGKGGLLLHAWYKHRLRDEYNDVDR